MYTYALDVYKNNVSNINVSKHITVCTSYTCSAEI